MRRILWAVAGLVALAGCAQPQPAAPKAVSPPAAQPAAVKPRPGATTTQPAPVATRPAATKTRPAATAEVSQSVLADIDGLFKITSQPKSPEETEQMLLTIMENVLRKGREVEQQYPRAQNLHEVRARMLQAADYLSRREEEATGPVHAQLLEIAGRLMDSPAPARLKAQADFHLTFNKVQAMIQANPDAPVEKLIEDFAGRYEKTEAAASATILATGLALRSQRRELADRLIQQIKTRHVRDPEARQFLGMIGQNKGLPFEAELKLLNGKKLSLPGDLLGKVVVIDFWATWCPPCVASVPKMKEFYAEYHPRGVEVVGISLDRTREDLEGFLKQNGLDWTQSFSGKGWGDPTAQAYGIRAIPAVWVIGRDGKVFSDKARENLVKVVEEALKQSATAPASKGP